MQNSMKEEIWKTIPCYKGYEASTLGRVRSKERLIRRNNRYKYYDVICMVAHYKTYMLHMW